MNLIDVSTPAGRELALILECQARRVGLLRSQGSGLRLPSLSALRKGSARQARLDDLRVASLEPIAAWR